MIRKLWDKFVFKMKLRRMDRRTSLMTLNCFGGYPPSFYYTHTKEEIEKIVEEEQARLRKMIDDYKNKPDKNSK